MENLDINDINKLLDDCRKNGDYEKQPQLMLILEYAVKKLIDDRQPVRINVQHPDIHKAVDAFWEAWNKNGANGKHGYYESTWHAINAAVRIVGVTKLDCKIDGYLDDWNVFFTERIKGYNLRPISFVQEENPPRHTFIQE